eukprot:scaffold22168_cov181-Amphora_coffeaeformis.AAC.1
MGNFGYVNTANGQAKLDGFGMVEWDVQSLFVFCPHKIIADTITLILQITISAAPPRGCQSTIQFKTTVPIGNHDKQK